MEEERFVSEVRAMERTLYRVARGYLRTWDECADAVQEALCKAWDKRKHVDESYFRPWLTRIVINECHNIGRRKKRLIPVAEPEREPVPEPVLPELADALDTLPEKLRLPLTLHYLEASPWKRSPGYYASLPEPLNPDCIRPETSFAFNGWRRKGTKRLPVRPMAAHGKEQKNDR